MTEEEELEYLQNHLQYVQERILQLRVDIQTRKVKKSPKRRPLWVQTSALSPYVTNYLNSEQMSMVVLAEEANVSDTTIKGIISNRTFWTSEIIADQILTAMGIPHILQELNPVVLSKIPTPPPSHYFED
jgi:hypothetical protein